MLLAVALLISPVLAAGCTSVISGRAVQGTTPAISGTSVLTPTPPASVTVSSPTAAPPAQTPAQDRPHETSGVPTPSITPPGPADLQVRHDIAFAALMGRLTSSLKSGSTGEFLAPFSTSLAGRVRQWFANTEALGVSAAMFAPADDYSSAATDSTASFTRTVVLGVRTPYDDDNSMPGIAYAATVTVTFAGGRQVLTITSWQPKYVDDPMNCDCKLAITHSATTAVVADAADRQLAGWSRTALTAAGGGIAWSYRQMQGSGLIAPRGQVIFLADRPFHWFLEKLGPGQVSNMTAGLLDARGPYPGTRYSDESRIVLMLRADDGTIVPNDAAGLEYAADVITHEATHQLMNRNSTLPGRSANSPPTWVVEGIAVAVETLYRDSLGNSGDVGYPEPNDPKNNSGLWFTEHLGAQMPTQGQLYSDSAEGTGYYALSGSVFRYIFREYGYVTMMKVAKAMYAKPAQSPFSYFPNADAPGSYLSPVAAKNRWKNWFVDNYE